MVKYQIQAAQLSDTGNYSCTVENKHGTTKQYAWYEIMPLPLSITIPNGRPYIAEENQPEFIIPCIVQSQSKYRNQFQVKWFLNDTEILSDGKIYNVSTCFPLRSHCSNGQWLMTEVISELLRNVPKPLFFFGVLR